MVKLPGTGETNLQNDDAFGQCIVFDHHVTFYKHERLQGNKGVQISLTSAFTCSINNLILQPEKIKDMLATDCTHTFLQPEKSGICK